MAEQLHVKQVSDIVKPHMYDLSRRVMAAVLDGEIRAGEPLESANKTLEKYIEEAVRKVAVTVVNASRRTKGNE